MIRNATAADIDVMIALGRKMHAESPRFSQLTFCPLILRANLNQLLTADGGIVLVYEREGEIIGGFLGLITQQWFSTDLVANDYALFLDPDHRGGIAAVRLIKQYIEIAKARGVKEEFIQMGVSTGVHIEDTGLLFRCLGLKQYGTIWSVCDGQS